MEGHQFLSQILGIVDEIINTVLMQHDITRLILILYVLSQYLRHLYIVFDTISRLWCQECKESCLVLKIT